MKLYDILRYHFSEISFYWTNRNGSLPIFEEFFGPVKVDNDFLCFLSDVITALAACSTLVAASSQDTSILVWATSALTAVGNTDFKAMPNLGQNFQNSLYVSDTDGSFMQAANNLKSINTIRAGLMNRQPIKKFLKHDASPLCIAFNADGTNLVSG